MERLLAAAAALRERWPGPPLELPPLPIFPLQELLRPRVVCALKCLGVPVKLHVAQAVGDDAKQDGFRQWAAVFEFAGRGGGLVVEAGLDPFGVVADAARDRGF